MSENKTILTLVSNGINSTLKGININKVNFVFKKKYFNQDNPIPVYVKPYEKIYVY
jgi:hypothetical protein